MKPFFEVDFIYDQVKVAELSDRSQLCEVVVFQDTFNLTVEDDFLFSKEKANTNLEFFSSTVSTILGKYYQLMLCNITCVTPWIVQS